MHHRFLFFFNDTPTTEIYTLSLHDALPISRLALLRLDLDHVGAAVGERLSRPRHGDRSEEHTSELQSPDHLVCRLLLEKKKKKEKEHSRGITDLSRSRGRVSTVVSITVLVK